MPDPVYSSSVRVRLVGEEKEPRKKKPKTPNPRPDAGENGGKQGEGEASPTRGLPRFVLLTQDGRLLENDQQSERWPDGFDENDGGMVQDIGSDEVIYKINYDNAYHIKYRAQQRGQISKDAITQKYILGMRILMLGHEHALRNAQRRADSNGDELAALADDIRRLAAKGAASTVLALAENLPKLVDLTDQTAE